MNNYIPKVGDIVRYIGHESPDMIGCIGEVENIDRYSSTFIYIKWNSDVKNTYYKSIRITNLERISSRNIVPEDLFSM